MKEKKKKAADLTARFKALPGPEIFTEEQKGALAPFFEERFWTQDSRLLPLVGSVSLIFLST